MDKIKTKASKVEEKTWLDTVENISEQISFDVFTMHELYPDCVIALQAVTDPDSLSIDLQ